MRTKAELADNEARAEAAYTAMYDAALHNVKDCYEDACLNLAQTIEIATSLQLTEDVVRLKNRGQDNRSRLQSSIPSCRAIDVS